MEKQVLAKDQFLAELNAALEKSPRYELGMKFMGIGKGGFHLFDRRYVALQRGQRKRDGAATAWWIRQAQLFGCTVR